MDRKDNELLGHFTTVSLEQLDGVALQSRYERKYLLPESRLPALLALFPQYYDMLEIAGHRSFDYRTDYYDTPGFALYRDHHNGYERRMKVRKRCYEQSGLSFFELKQRKGNGATEKQRMSSMDMLPVLSPGMKQLVPAQRVDPDTLEYKLRNYFQRSTLCDKQRTERLTIDTGIHMSVAERQHCLTGIALIEIKQLRPGNYSPAVQLLRQAGIRETAFSKYATGVALLYPELKHNNLKPILLKIRS